MPQDKLIEIYRAVTKPAKIPWLNENGTAVSNIPKETVTRWQKVAVMYRYMYGTLLKKLPDGWEMRWAWYGHRHEFPTLFEKDEVKEDLKKAKKLEAKQSVLE